jgi:hypothetical protein
MPDDYLQRARELAADPGLELSEEVEDGALREIASMLQAQGRSLGEFRWAAIQPPIG